MTYVTSTKRRLLLIEVGYFYFYRLFLIPCEMLLLTVVITIVSIANSYIHSWMLVR